MALTVTKIKALTERGRYPDEKSLYLFVQSPTSKTWVQRLTINGQTTGHRAWPMAGG